MTVAGPHSGRSPLSGGWRAPPETAFLSGLAYLSKSQTFVQLAGTRVVLLHIEVEGDAGRRCLCLEVLDDGGTYALTLDAGKQLNARELDVVNGAGDPQPADPLVIDLNHIGGGVRDLAPDLLRCPLAEALAPLPFVEVARKPALSPRSLDDHIGKEPDVPGSGWP
jgi:hypothetical protein